MSFRITFPLEDLKDRELAEAELLILLSALATLDLQYLRRNPRAPTLAAAPVLLTDARSRLLAPNQEEWKDASTALSTGRLDAPSAVAWRIAELQARGIATAPDVVSAGSGYRFLVKLPNGQTEDVAPSAGRPYFDRVRISFLLNLFKSRAQEPLSHEGLRVLLQALTMIDVLYLQTHPGTPKLRDSGVVYREEPPGAEDWQDIPTSLRRRVADCDEWGPWRAAEHIVEGRKAMADFDMQRQPDGRVLYHIVTRTERGTEDPSYEQGMR